jgi:hypothetical protein
LPLYKEERFNEQLVKIHLESVNHLCKTWDYVYNSINKKRNHMSEALFKGLWHSAFIGLI